MKILIVGNGGRENTLRWHAKKFKHSADMVPYKNIDDIDDIVEEARTKGYNLTIVGPEQPLVDGIVDAFSEYRLPIFGPTQAAAELEKSKVFAKNLMGSYKIPTAEFKVAHDVFEAEKYANEILEDYCGVVIKADGLALGKGVIVCSNIDEAVAAIKLMMVDKKFGDAGKRVVVEERLKGEEASFIAITDGETIVPLASSQDHKPVYETADDRNRFIKVAGDDHGPLGKNTGGMGAYSPAPVVTKEVYGKIMEEIMWPAVNAMKDEGKPFAGVLYAGLMIKEGEPKVLEFNVRFGDPETQPQLIRLKSDLFEYMLAASRGKLDVMPELVWDPRPAVCVVMASGGYPESPAKGYEITGIEAARQMQDVAVFEAGTKHEDGKIYNSGGRVLGVTALGNREGDFEGAIKRAYDAVDKITWEKAFYRTDIGAKAIGR